MNAEEANAILNVVGLRIRDMTLEEAADDIKNDRREGDHVVVMPQGVNDYAEIVCAVLKARLFGGVSYAEYQAGKR